MHRLRLASSAWKTGLRFSRSCAKVLPNKYWQRASHAGESSACVGGDVPGEMNVRWEAAAALAVKAGLLDCNQLLVAPAAYAAVKADTLEILKKFHDANPLVAGIGKEELRDRANLGPEVFYSVLDKLVGERKLTSPAKSSACPDEAWS